jgi:hypothetical protein
MKKILFLSIVTSFLFSCNNSSAPKEVAKNFIEAVYAADYATASSMASAETKDFVTKQKTDAKPSLTAEESFTLSNLTETVMGNSAIVKNENISISLKKEKEGWRVVSDENTITAIKNRETNLTALKTAWEKLLKEYEGRLQAAKEYVGYKKSNGALSDNVKKLEDVVNSLSVKTTWDKEKILLYVQKQKQVHDLIDKALEPSYTANADMSMNYFLQLSNASDRIETAQGVYHDLVQKTPSAIYPMLPVKATNSIKANEN